MNELSCCVCGYVWLPRIEKEPKLCPRCKSRKWHGRTPPKRLTIARLRELLDYDPSTGVFMWKEHSRGGRAMPLKEVGGISAQGYRSTSIDGRRYQVHRLVWFWHHGYFPENNIDHIDRDKLNNRIENLREASKVCNARNCGNHSHNTSGVKGVSSCSKTARHGKPWKATIAINKKQRHLGVFADITEAVAHRLAAEQCLNWAGCDSCSPAYLYMKGVLNK